MPPTLGLRRALQSRGRGLGFGQRTVPSSVCLFCSFATRPSTFPTSSPLNKLRATRAKPQEAPAVRPRYQSTGATPLRPFISTPSDAADAAPAEPEPIDPRKDLESALRDLQTLAPNHVNLPRLQLALRNLSQDPGHESIRVAFLGLTTGDKPQHTARELLRLALADPLKSAQNWEAQLKAHDPSKPLIVHIGPPEEQATPLSLAASEHVIPEITVPSHIYNDANLEMIVMEADQATVAQAGEQPHTFDEAILVPAVDTAATTAGHSAPIVTPVHMAVLVADGVLSAASILSLPISPESQDTITAVANFKRISAEDKAACPSLVITSVEAGAQGLDLFRESASNAMKYEALWTEAGVGHINKWLRSNVLSQAEQEGATKAPVRKLIESILHNAGAALQAAEYRDMKVSVEGGPSPHTIARLNQALADWAKDAHEELQQQLEIAFVGEAWRQMNWWKLFWRVDDVGMLSSEMIAQRFLPEAEKRLIFLAGRLQEAGITTAGGEKPVTYSGPAVPPSFPEGESSVATTAATTESETKGNWPAHIPFTRNYLLAETVPALQALAQKLVLQSSTLAGATTALGGMSWLSGFGIYECGAVAALGIVLSLRGLQKRWERARDFWEGEVREEGRKAIRATEASIAEVLDSVSPEVPEDVAVEIEELKEAKSVLKRAEEALARLK
ncbi:hypothetical protein GE21DRAFT_7191 [Neurospora crassa]|uniref:Mmc1 C-terminal domain-containing protein n=2 Tax=Neurospora crassa TaxID=5141 RepID=Q1K7Q9_NEUCR|nr:hypothetical protein NCU03624 [Neurospora crassa OR74A]EAA32115.1 hypothetical protein NCU03624 [Neurospora crassa OR74A]KHE88832.1 hypothetical protein GE21DRAFT_7191 [Neurospora crassa]CAC28703.1 hypothetical protein [Neurospora crassa]|eukprot:XP_961351.1 hypothetical protein NCU03624 [Neurospora crassa OR74A]